MLLDGCDKRPLASQHLLANESKQQDSYRDTEESIHHAQTLAKGGNRGEISVTWPEIKIKELKENNPAI